MIKSRLEWYLMRDAEKTIESFCGSSTIPLFLLPHPSLHSIILFSSVFPLNPRFSRLIFPWFLHSSHLTSSPLLHSSCLSLLYLAALHHHFPSLATLPLPALAPAVKGTTERLWPLEALLLVTLASQSVICDRSGTSHGHFNTLLGSLIASLRRPSPFLPSSHPPLYLQSSPSSLFTASLAGKKKDDLRFLLHLQRKPPTLTALCCGSLV